MRTKLLYVLAISLGTVLFTSCDDDSRVLELPEITISTINYETLQGQPVVITPSYKNVDAATTYEWTVNGNTAALATTPTFTYDAKELGDAEVNLRVVNTDGYAEQKFYVSVKRDLRVLTFEESAWESLIDSKQYGGSLLYGTDYSNPVEYDWFDETTQLSSSLTASWGGYYGYAEGGIAISNYIDDNIKEHNTYNYQLSVPVSNGSKNFAVVYCGASMCFADGKAREITKMDIAPTTYELGVITYGDGYAVSLAESGELTLHINGIKEDGTEFELQSVSLAENGKLLDKWLTGVSVCSAGQKVCGLSFSMTGSDVSAWGGLNSPTYFAFDNVEVDYYAE